LSLAGRIGASPGGSSAQNKQKADDSQRSR
jgi:hypothetical protein